jgi:hypothetical protein
MIIKNPFRVARRRLLAATVGLAVALPAAAVAGAMPAQADLLPYVPWSSVLPGLTTTYVSPTDNTCVDGASTCLAQTLQAQGQIADDTAHSCDHNAIFARAYVHMTELYGYTREIPGYYQDVPYINHLDAVFAKYYTDAYGNWQSGNRSAVPQAWLITLDAAKAKKVSGTGDLLLGMNAHINRDLPYVMAAVGLVGPDGSSRKADYDAVEQWLYDATAPLIAELAQRFDPTVDDTSDPFGITQAALFQLVSTWRENAWRNAEALVSASTPDARALVAKNIEAQATTIAQSLVATQSYVPLLSSSAPRDAWCSLHKDDAPPLPYAFGPADAYGTRY